MGHTIHSSFKKTKISVSADLLNISITKIKILLFHQLLGKSDALLAVSLSALKCSMALGVPPRSYSQGLAK